MPRQLEYDAFKGILICLIVLGHNTLFSSHYPQAFNSIYNFHVASFLLLPFVFSGASAAQYQLRDRATRYLVPHFMFFSVACVAFLVLFVPKEGAAIANWLPSIPVAVLFSSEGAYRAACGFGLFWFLPALLTLTLLRAAWLRGGRGRRAVILGGALAVHLLLGLLPQGWLRWIPWGWPLAAFLFPLALLVSAVWGRGVNRDGWFVLFALVFAGCMWLGLVLPSSAGLAGDPRVYAIDQPLRLLLHDLYLLSAFLTLLLLCWRLPAVLCKALAYVGERSLFVFLAHSFVFRALVMLGFVDWLDSSVAWPVLSVAVSVGLTLAVTLAGYGLLRTLPWLYDVVFPRDYACWRKTQGMAGT